MRKMHHIGETWKLDQVISLAKYRIFVVEGVFSYIHVDPDEFELIKGIVFRDQPIHVFGADFDTADLDNADWLALNGLQTFGRPQPDDNFDFLDLVYDMSKKCEKCGIFEGKQKQPFRIKSDKTKLAAFQLEWINDEVFVGRDIYEDLFQPIGLGFWPVLIHRSDEISERLVQLDIPESDWQFDMKGMPFEVCSGCNEKKYQVRPLDFLPNLNRRTPNEIFRGLEFYGSGGQADKRIYLSQRLRQELMKRKIAKWFQFYPLKSMPKVGLAN